MEIRKEQRGESPAELEEIGLGKWHVRWSITNVTDEEGKELYLYNEVELDHRPTTAEVRTIKAMK